MEEQVLDTEVVPGDGAVVEDGNDSGGTCTGNTVRVERMGDVEILRPSSPTGLTLVLLPLIYSIK